MMRKAFNLFVSILFCCFAINNVFAQQQKEHEKGSYVDSLGRYYQQASLPAYVYVSTSPNSTPTMLKEAEMKNVGPIYLDGHGVHNLRHINSEDNRVENFQLYADGVAPITTVSLSGAPMFNNGRMYYGKNLSLSLRATDEMSGLKDVFFSQNEAGYIPYRHIIQFHKEGDYTFRYYSIDNVGNTEVAHQTSFVVDLSPPKTYYKIVGITGDKVMSLSTQISISAEDSLSGVLGTYYSFDDEPYKKGNGTISIQNLDNGEHTLSFYSIDNVNNQEEPSSITFYLDRTAPIMSADILGDKFIVDDKVYFSGRTKVKLTAIDNRAGIEQVMFSINNGTYQVYTDPFYLPFESGKYVIQYYATDKVGNNTGEDKITHSSGVVYVDLTGPIITDSFEGLTFKNGDVVYLSSRVGNKLSAIDEESGLQRMAYIIDDSEEQPYFKPFTLQEEGLHRIYAVAYDNVNNRNEKPFSVFVDNEGPEIGYSYSTKPISMDGEVEVYPSYVTLFLSAFDDVTTVSSIMVSVNGGAEKSFTAPIQGFERSQTYTIKVRALDVLGNESSKVFTFKTNDI